MTLAYAIHEIIVSPTKKIEPNTVYDAQDFDEMLRLGAVREPTKDEVALYRIGAGETMTAATQEPVQQEAPKGSDPVAQEPAKQKTERELLEDRATAAGVEFRSNIGDEKLLERVLEAEKAAASTDKDVTEAPTTLV